MNLLVQRKDFSIVRGATITRDLNTGEREQKYTPLLRGMLSPNPHGASRAPSSYFC
jgi:hypothetical protein